MSQEKTMNLINQPNMEPKKIVSILKTNPPETQEGNIASQAQRVDNIWINNSEGNVALYWEADGVESYDYVALYDHVPNGDPWSYLTNQWQWTAGNNSPYVTGTQGRNQDWWIAYCRYSYERRDYEVQKEDGPFRV